MTNIPVASNRRHAERLVDLLVDCGPLTSAEICSKLGWSKGRFSTALKMARESVCPDLGLIIPAPTPGAGWLYQVTTDWEPVEAGASHSLGLVETRLNNTYRDVTYIKPHLVRGSVEWRRANFLEKHLSHITRTLKEINGG